MATTQIETISFARGVPAPDCLPVEELADCARAVLEADGKTILSYGTGAGYTPLRERLARGQTVFVESPTYDRPLKILLQSGASIAYVPIDEQGLSGQALSDAFRQ